MEGAALLGPGKYNGFFLDNPSDDIQWELDDVEPLIRPTEGIDGQILRFVLANRWLDFGGQAGCQSPCGPVLTLVHSNFAHL